MIKWQWDQVDNFEKNKEWLNAYQYMKREWHNGGNEITKYIRYSFLNWYLIVEGDVIGLDTKNDEEYFANLVYLFQLGKDKYWDNPYFLGIYGYMISITPYIIGDDVEYWISKSNEMLIKANEISKDSFLKLLSLGNETPFNKKSYNQIFLDNESALENALNGEGVFQEYFLDLFKSLARY